MTRGSRAAKLLLNAAMIPFRTPPTHILGTVRQFSTVGTFLPHFSIQVGQTPSAARSFHISPAVGKGRNSQALDDPVEAVRRGGSAPNETRGADGPHAESVLADSGGLRGTFNNPKPSAAADAAGAAAASADTMAAGRSSMARRPSAEEEAAAAAQQYENAGWKAEPVLRPVHEEPAESRAERMARFVDRTGDLPDFRDPAAEGSFSAEDEGRLGKPFPEASREEKEYMVSGGLKVPGSDEPIWTDKEPADKPEGAKTFGGLDGKDAPPVESGRA